MKSWEIWMEGYAVTGNSSPASFVGKADGALFEDAVRAWYAAHPDPVYFDSKRLTFWGCRHFPTEAEARNSFG